MWSQQFSNSWRKIEKCKINRAKNTKWKAFSLPLMLLLRFVAFALLPKPMMSAVRMALLPLPFWPTNKFVRTLKSTVRFEWHMKFRNFTVNILPLLTPKSNSPKSTVEFAIELPIPSSFTMNLQCNQKWIRKSLQFSCWKQREKIASLKISSK